MQIFFVDDIVIVEKTREEANIKLEEWRVILEGKRLHISRMKTEYMIEQDTEPDVTIRKLISQVQPS